MDQNCRGVGKYNRNGEQLAQEMVVRWIAGTEIVEYGKLCRGGENIGNSVDTRNRELNIVRDDLQLEIKSCLISRGRTQTLRIFLMGKIA